VAIEISAKPKVKVSKLAVSLAIFAFLAYSASGFLYWYFSSQAFAFSTQAQEKEKSLVETDSEKQVKSYVLMEKLKIDNFSTLLKNHKKVSNIFIKVEQLTHPEIQFTNFDFAPSTNKVKLEGRAKSFYSLGQQFLVLKQEPLIKAINFSGISMDKEQGLIFSVEITFDGKAFE